MAKAVPPQPTSAADPNERQVRVRGERQPGHCWQDNELYCCFGPVIGMDAVAVYGQLTVREENGRAAFSLRDMGRWLDKSKDTVKRAIAVLEVVGLVQASDQVGPRGIATLVLVNLKDLAESYGASYDRKVRSYTLPAEKIAELRARVAELRRELARQRGAKKAASVANSDSGAFFAAPANCDRSGADRDRSVANSDSPLFITEDKEKDILPLPPPQAKGVQCVTPLSADLEKAQAAFTGVHERLKTHLLNDRPRGARPDLANGFDDWTRFAFGDLAVQSAARQARGWVLVISSPDAEKTRAGLAKYEKTWWGALREWYGSVATVTVVQRQQERRQA